MPLEIVRNDITRMEVDAVVNSANPHPIVGGGADQAIHDRAGEELLAARKEIGDIAAGEAFITPGFRLPAKYVIHTVGPVWRDGRQDERGTLTRCYQNSLRLAVEHGCTSIAFPLISAGIYGCPVEVALATATQAIRDFLRDHEMEIYLVVFDQEAFRISSGLFEDVRNYLDETYVDQALLRESGGRPARNRRRTREEPDRCQEGFLLMARPPGLWKLERGKEKASTGKPTAAVKKKRALSDLLKEVDDTFSQALLRLIDARDRKDSEIYRRANIDRRHFSKIRNTPNYQPSKTTALALAIALELNLDETKDFIGRAGYALSHSSKMDIIVEYFIENGEYDIFTINETLFAFDQPCLG